MINVVFFAVYLGVVSILPQSIFKEVDRKRREYLWGATTKKKNFHLWLGRWSIIQRNQGGECKKNCRIRNIALVGKLLWQLIANKESILGKVGPRVVYERA